MLKFYFVTLISFVFASHALAVPYPGDEMTCQSLGGEWKLILTHTDDTDKDQGLYTVDVARSAVPAEKKSATSLDTFDMAEALYAPGDVRVDFDDGSGGVVISGSPFEKRSARITLEGVTLDSVCKVGSDRGQIHCEQKSTPKGHIVFRVRHLSDFGRTTGYYQTRLFSIDDSSQQFTKNLVPTLSLNYRLLNDSIAAHEPVEFTFAVGTGGFRFEKFTDGKSFAGRMILGDDEFPIDCELVD